jgi:hypothetical protein
MIIELEEDDDFIESSISQPNFPTVNSVNGEKTKKRQNVGGETKSRKDANKAAKAAANCTKKEQEQQLTGYYRQQELSFVMEDELHRSDLGGEIAATLLFMSESKNYGMFSIESTVPGLCRWTYRNFLDGGNGTVGEEGVVTLPLAMIIYPPQKFIDIAMQNDDGSNFSAMISEIRDIRDRLVAAESCPRDVKIVLVLVNIHDECLQYQRVSSVQFSSC